MKRLSRWTEATALAALLLVTAACLPGNNGGGWGVGGSQGDASTQDMHARGGIVVAVFPDIVPVMQALVPIWQRAYPNIPVAFSVAPSDNTAVNQNTYITQDVLISDSRTVQVDAVGQGLLVNKGVTVAATTLDFAMPAGNPGGIATLQDISRPGLNLVYMRWNSGLAQYTHATLERMMRDAAFAPANVACHSNYAECVLGNMTLAVGDGISAGRALANNGLVSTPVPGAQFPLDGAFIYHTDTLEVVRLTGVQTLATIPVPTAFAPPNGIWAAVSSFPGVNEGNATLFQQFLLSPAAQSVFAAQGYLPPSAAAPNATGSEE